MAEITGLTINNVDDYMLNVICNSMINQHEYDALAYSIRFTPRIRDKFQQILSEKKSDKAKELLIILQSQENLPDNFVILIKEIFAV
jgi:hypothetical protein